LQFVNSFMLQIIFGIYKIRKHIKAQKYKEILIITFRKATKVKCISTQFATCTANVSCVRNS